MKNLLLTLFAFILACQVSFAQSYNYSQLKDFVLGNDSSVVLSGTVSSYNGVLPYQAPQAMCLAGDGNVYCAALSGASTYRLGKITPNGTCSLAMQGGAPLNTTLAISNIVWNTVDNAIWFTNVSGNNIYRYDPVALTSITYTIVGMSGSALNSLIADPVSGDLFAANNNTGNIVRISHVDGSLVAQYPYTGGAAAGQWCVGPDGRLWGWCGGNNASQTVFALTFATGAITTYGFTSVSAGNYTGTSVCSDGTYLWFLGNAAGAGLAVTELSTDGVVINSHQVINQVPDASLDQTLGNGASILSFQNRIWITESGAGRLMVLDPSNQTAQDYGSALLATPTSMIVGQDNNSLWGLSGITSTSTAIPNSTTIFRYQPTGQLVVSSGDITTNPTTMQYSRTVNDNGNPIICSGFNSVLLHITGTIGSATINFEASPNNIDWVAISGVKVGVGTVATTTTVVSDWQINVTGYNYLRARISGASGTTVTVIGLPTRTTNANAIGAVSLNTGTNSIGTVGLNAGANIIGALTANQSVNGAQINGVTTSVSNGTTDTGTQRVTLSSDSTGQVKLATGANIIGALTANQSVNITQFGGTTLSATNPLPNQLSQGNAALSTTNGTYTNILQGNAVLSQTNGLPVVEVPENKATYIACNVAYTIPATPTDMVVFGGSGTKTVKILRVRLIVTDAAAGIQQFILLKRSTADSAGTPNVVTPVSMDSNNAAATATMNYYTANPTTGTLVGNITVVNVQPQTTTLSTPAYYELFDHQLAGQPLVLRGTAEQIALNFAGATLPSTLKVALEVTWTEE